ncbi:MAG: response regulator [Proteobacteria bacterium]|nr:response regulator [Pseudomonadota bacterium]
MSQESTSVFLVEDDPTVRDSLARSIRVAGYRVEAFASAEAFLAVDPCDRQGCVIADVRLGGMSGLELQGQLAKRSPRLPVIIVTGNGDIAMAVEAMQAGAVDFIEKPCSRRALLNAITRALAWTGPVRGDGALTSGDPADDQRIHALTGSEKQVLAQLLRTGTTRSIADALDISLAAVEFHRARIMEKTGAETSADLVRFALAGNLAALDVALRPQARDDPAALLHGLTDVARSILGARVAAAVVFDRDPGKIRWFSASGLDACAAPLAQDFSARSPLVALAMERRPRRIQPISAAPEFVGLPAAFPPIKSFLGVPLATAERVFGWLALANKLDAVEFTGEDERVALHLADQVTRALELDLLNNELHTRVEQQRAVARFAATALGATDLQALFDDAVAITRQTLGVEYCAILEFEGATNSLVVRAGAGWPEGIVGSATVPATPESLVGQALVSDEPVVFVDLATERRFRAAPFMYDCGVVSGLTVAIPSATNPFGTLGAHTTRSRRFTSDDVEFARTIATVLGQAIIARQTDTRLRHAQKLEALGTLAGGIAHEINTPTQYIGDNIRFLEASFRDLGPVLDAAAALREALRDEPQWTALCTAMQDAEAAADLAFLRTEIPAAIGQSLDGVERVRQIVLAVKEFCHPDVKEMAPTDLHRLVQTTITVSRNQWKYVAELVTDFANDLPPIPCRAGEINQVILNLIVNAAHAIEAKRAGMGTILIETIRLEDAVEIRVTDSGTGIPPEIRARIFDPFFTTKGPGKGTGQGLAICHTIVVQKHGGSISVESSPGQGTTFAVRLPLEPPPAADDVAEAAA